MLFRSSSNTRAHQESIQKVSEEAIVLLKNDNNLLPFDKTKVKKVALIGDNANRIHSLGGGSSEIKALYEISPLLGIRTYLGGNVEVKYAPGYYVDNEKNVIGEVDWQATSLEVDYTTEHGQKLREEELLPKQEAYLSQAIALAKECDLVLFVGGLNHAFDTEGFDKSKIGRAHV